MRAALDAYPDDPSGLPDGLAGEGFAQLQRFSESVETKGVEELRAVVREWSRAVDADEALHQAERLRDRRRLDAYPTGTGMVRVEGELDPENGEAILTALQGMVDAELRSSGGNDLRTPSQRRADALGELCRR